MSAPRPGWFTRVWAAALRKPQYLVGCGALIIVLTSLQFLRLTTEYLGNSFEATFRSRRLEKVGVRLRTGQAQITQAILLKDPHLLHEGVDSMLTCVGFSHTGQLFVTASDQKLLREIDGIAEQCQALETRYEKRLASIPPQEIARLEARVDAAMEALSDLEVDAWAEASQVTAALESRLWVSTYCLMGFSAFLLATIGLLTWSSIRNERAAQAVRESEEMFRSLSASSPVGIFRTDASGACTYVNERWSEITGYSSEDAMGDGWIQMIHPEDRDATIEGWLQRDRQSIFSREVQLQARDGSVRWVQAQAAPIRTYPGADEGKSVGWIGNLKDITDRKRSEAEILAAKNAAEAATRAKSAFLANMSHELRTPLNAIIGYSEILQEEAAECGQQGWLPDLQKINSSGRHLLALISDILDLSKIEAGRCDLSPASFSVQELVEDVSQAASPLCAKNGNRFSVDYPADLGEIVTDRARVGQCLLNLLSNAAKFTREGEVRLEISRQSGDGNPKQEYFCFRVIDTGIGMTEAELDRIFHEFVQADDSATRNFGGTGLGLAITQRLARLMGGEITADSEPGKGSVFTLMIPRSLDEAPATPPAASAA